MISSRHANARPGVSQSLDAPPPAQHRPSPRCSRRGARPAARHSGGTNEDNTIDGNGAGGTAARANPPGPDPGAQQNAPVR